MSLNSEITRIEQAKQDIKTSIIGKGVNIPDSVLIDNYSTYIDQIQQGSEIDHSEKDLLLIIRLDTAEFANETFYISREVGSATVGFEFTTDDYGTATVRIQNNYVYYITKDGYYSKTGVNGNAFYFSDNYYREIKFLPVGSTPEKKEVNCAQMFMRYNAYNTFGVPYTEPSWSNLWSTIKPTSLASTFRDSRASSGKADIPDNIDFSVIDTSSCDNMNYIFYGTWLGNRTLDLSTWDVSNVDRLTYAFSNCNMTTTNIIWPTTMTKPCDIRYIGQSGILSEFDMGWIDTSYPDKNYYTYIFTDGSSVNTNIKSIKNFTCDYYVDATHYPFGVNTEHITMKPGHSICRDLNENFTLNLQNLTKLDPNEFIESLTAYTGSYTRTIKFKSTVYDTITSENLALANTLHYTLTRV